MHWREVAWVDGAAVKWTVSQPLSFPSRRRPWLQAGQSLTIEIVADMDQQCQEAVVQEAGERPGHVQIFSGRKSETNIFVAEECGECAPRISDRRSAIGFVDRDVEQHRGQEVEILPPVEVGFANKRHCLAERLFALSVGYVYACDRL
jgi:hypothetical protein